MRLLSQQAGTGPCTQFTVLRCTFRRVATKLQEPACWCRQVACPCASCNNSRILNLFLCNLILGSSEKVAEIFRFLLKSGSVNWYITCRLTYISVRHWSIIREIFKQQNLFKKYCTGESHVSPSRTFSQVLQFLKSNWILSPVIS
jgi:hypothetical protein